jgi:hypothetical protein
MYQNVTYIHLCKDEEGRFSMFFSFVTLAAMMMIIIIIM